MDFFHVGPKGWIITWDILLMPAYYSFPFLSQTKSKRYNRSLQLQVLEKISQSPQLSTLILFLKKLFVVLPIFPLFHHPL